MYQIQNSQVITGYPVKIFSRTAFNVVGFTRIIPPHHDRLVPLFWDELTGDGRLEQLRTASRVHPWLLGMRSWDPDCEEKGFRYTVCMEETPYTDFAPLAQAHDLFRKEIGASEWLSFEMTDNTYHQRFWQDNPFKLIGLLGFQFHTGDDSVGLYFDAYPPNFAPNCNALMEFWIAVRCADR